MSTVGAMKKPMMESGQRSRNLGAEAAATAVVAAGAQAGRGEANKSHCVYVGFMVNEVWLGLKRRHRYRRRGRTRWPVRRRLLEIRGGSSNCPPFLAISANQKRQLGLAGDARLDPFVETAEVDQTATSLCAGE